MAKQTAPLPYLLTLPPELLTPIFQQADISLSNLVICRTLLPYTLHALLVQVDLYSQAQIRSFHRAVQDDSKARLVRVLTISTVLDRESDLKEEKSDGEDSSDEQSSSDDEEGSADEATSPRASKLKVSGGDRQQTVQQSIMERLGSLALDDSSTTSLYARSSASTASTASNEEHEPEVLLFHEVLTDTVRRLVNLENYEAIGKDVACLFQENFYRPGAVPKLQRAMVLLQPGEDFDEDDHPLFVAASRLPALKHLVVTGVCQQLPLDIPAFSIIDQLKRPIPAHSWGLTSLNLTRVKTFGSACRYLFSALDRLEYLELEGSNTGGTFAQDLSLLPKTLSGLTITLLGDLQGLSRLPTLDYLTLWFPNLVHLHLTGNIFTPALLTNLHFGQHLRCLLFGHDTPISIDTLLPLVKLGSPLRIRALDFLNVHLCWTVPFDAITGRPLFGARKVAVWTDEMSKKGARKLVKACVDADVELSGGVACALRICDCAQKQKSCDTDY